MKELIELIVEKIKWEVENRAEPCGLSGDIKKLMEMIEEKPDEFRGVIIEMIENDDFFGVSCMFSFFEDANEEIQNELEKMAIDKFGTEVM